MKLCNMLQVKQCRYSHTLLLLHYYPTLDGDHTCGDNAVPINNENNILALNGYLSFKRFLAALS